MYEQDIVFGPLTIKQFFVLLIAFISSYFIYKISENYIAIFIIMVCSFYFAFYVYKNKKIPINEIGQYFAIKKSELSEDYYRKMIKQKIVNIQYQIEFRKKRGLVEDTDLIEVLDVLRAL